MAGPPTCCFVSRVYVNDMKRLNFNYDVEVLRVCAIFLIIFQNSEVFYDIFRVLENRNRHIFSYGVDIFLVISGFFVGRSILGMRELKNIEGRFSLFIAFMGRRFARLFPAALLWIFIYLSFVSIADDPLRLAFIGENLAGGFAAFFWYANFYSMRCEALETFCSMIQPYWSISLEMQFYLIAAAIFAILKPRYIIFIFIALAFFLIALNRPLLSFGWYFRMEGMAAGVCLAILTYRGQLRVATSARTRWLLRLIVLACLCILPFITTRPSWFAYQTSLVSLVSIVLVGAVAANADLLFRNRLTEPLIRYLGSRSYAMFLSNMFVLMLFRYATDRTFAHENKYFLFALAFVVILIVSELTYRFVEKPWIEFGRMFFSDPERVRAKRRGLALALVVLLGAGSVFAATKAEDMLLNVQRSRVGSYIAPKIDGRLIELTPFEWRAEDIPPPEAVKRTAALLCRRLGHRDVVFFWPDRLKDPKVERFVNFVSFETRTFDRGLYYFQRIHCIG